MKYFDYYLDVWKKYAVFTGRARRKEYWYFLLFNIIISFIIGIVAGAIKLNFLSTIYGLAALIPGIAVGVRRLHDTDRSGWWMFIGLIPIIGTIILIVFFAKDSIPGTNKYGPNPKGEMETPPMATPSNPTPSTPVAPTTM